MTPASELPQIVRGALVQLATAGDRDSPTVFAGREGEFRLLENAVDRVREGRRGLTVVIQGVPGAGKTALLNEYATRLLATNADAERPVIPVPLNAGTLNTPPAAIVEEIDRRFRELAALGASKKWDRMANRAVGGAALLGNALFAAVTRKNIQDFTPSARAPESLPIALEDYVDFRFGRRKNTLVFLVDEAQNLHDTLRVRDYLEVLHGGIAGDTQALLVCFGLKTTTDRLAELGLSRLARGHARTIGVLSNEDAQRIVTGTLEVAFADYSFDDGHDGSLDEARRTKWIGEATAAILAESGNFPHHLTNGCCTLAEIVLSEGVAAVPPAEKLRDQCQEHKREYYAARLQPWSHHTTALAHAFAGGGECWTPMDNVMDALMASDDRGRPVDEETALAVIDGLCATGFIEQGVASLRPLLPSLSSHFQAVQQNAPPDNKVVRAVRAALPAHDDGGRGAS